MQGGVGQITAKMNSLVDESIIEALYEASQAGVNIELIVRGACSLRPGVSGMSENIRVRSIVGRFLEHSRIFNFLNEGANDVYLSSADWMNRNLFRRIEIAFPVLDPQLKKRVLQEGLQPYLKDNQNSWELDSAGVYHRHKARTGQTEFSVQQH
jgi:polyphosphate kinase